MGKLFNYILCGVLYAASISMYLISYIEENNMREYLLASFVGFCAASLQQMLCNRE